ncbi:hypothetical protein ES708_02000 [subsurface metagenome]
MGPLKTILIIVILFVATPFTMALAKLSGLSEFSQKLIAVVGMLICYAIALIKTDNGGS